MAIRTPLAIDVANCARCGGDHKGLEFCELGRPMNDGGTVWTHWAKCPDNCEPLMLRIQFEDDAPEEPADG